MDYKIEVNDSDIEVFEAHLIKVKNSQSPLCQVARKIIGQVKVS